MADQDYSHYSSAAAADQHDDQSGYSVFLADQDQAGEPLRTRTGRIRKARKGLRVHACDVCGKVYTRNEHLKRHQQLHTENQPSRRTSRRRSSSIDESGDDSRKSDEKLFPLNDNLEAESSSAGVMDASFELGDTVFMDDFANLLDDTEVMGPHMAHVFEDTADSIMDSTNQAAAYSVQDVESLGRMFQEKLHNDFHYHRFVQTTHPYTPNATKGPLPEWKKMIELMGRHNQQQKGQRRSAAYRTTFYSSSGSSPHSQVYQSTFWNLMHPHLRVFDSLANFKESMVMSFPSLLLIVMALGAAISPSPADQEHGHVFAEDALEALSSTSQHEALDGGRPTIVRQRASVLMDVYLTFFSRVPITQQPYCVVPTDRSKFQSLHTVLHDLRATLHLPPIPNMGVTHPPPGSRLTNLLHDLTASLPLRSLLVVAGQSFLNGAKVSFDAHNAAKHILRQWTQDHASTARARALSRDVLTLCSRPDMRGCPWRERCAFIACLASWAVRYAEGDVGVALVEARELLEEGTRGGWIGTDIVDTLGVLEDRGSEVGWF